MQFISNLLNFYHIQKQIFFKQSPINEVLNISLEFYEDAFLNVTSRIFYNILSYIVFEKLLEGRKE